MIQIHVSFSKQFLRQEISFLNMFNARLQHTHFGGTTSFERHFFSIFLSIPDFQLAGKINLMFYQFSFVSMFNVNRKEYINKLEAKWLAYFLIHQSQYILVRKKGGAHRTDQRENKLSLQGKHTTDAANLSTHSAYIDHLSLGRKKRAKVTRFQNLIGNQQMLNRSHLMSYSNHSQLRGILSNPTQPVFCMFL